MKQVLALIFIAVALSLFMLFILTNSNMGFSSRPVIKEIYTKKIYIKNIPIYAEIADTQSKRKNGLSGRLGLSQDQGMLLVFENSDTYGIWMKDMNFPIDVMWIDEKSRIVDIKKYARPSSYPEIFSPRIKSLYILEMSAGFAERTDIKVGDEINFGDVI